MRMTGQPHATRTHSSAVPCQSLCQGGTRPKAAAKRARRAEPEDEAEALSTEGEESGSDGGEGDEEEQGCSIPAAELRVTRMAARAAAAAAAEGDIEGGEEEDSEEEDSDDDMPLTALVAKSSELSHHLARGLRSLAVLVGLLVP